MVETAVPKEYNSDEGAQDDGNDGGFGTEGTASDDLGAIDGGGEYRFTGILARDG